MLLNLLFHSEGLWDFTPHPVCHHCLTYCYNLLYRPNELIELARAWHAMEIPENTAVYMHYRKRLMELLPAISLEQLCMLLECDSFFKLLGPVPSGTRHEKALTNRSVVRTLVHALLSKLVSYDIIALKGHTTDKPAETLCKSD